MSWVAEILRKQHRACADCGLGPTHLYDPEHAASREKDATTEEDAAGLPGIPLCHACLGRHLARDLSSFEGRCLLFEPSLGPDALVYRALQVEASGGWPEDQVTAARSCLDRIGAHCATCGGAGRYLWVSVAPDANLWAGDWLACLADGTLAPSDTLCGRCAAVRLVKSMEDRGLCFEAIVPPRGVSSGADGAIYGSEL